MHLSDSLPTKDEQELAVRDWLNRASEEQDGQDNQCLYRRCQSYTLNILQLQDSESHRQRPPRQLARC